MNDFREALARFREVVHREGERSQIPSLRAILERERSAKGSRLRWAAAAAGAALLLGGIPAYQNVHRRQLEAEQEKADALLLQQISAGLSRSVPRAMAPLMGWVPVKAEIQEDR